MTDEVVRHFGDLYHVLPFEFESLIKAGLSFSELVSYHAGSNVDFMFYACSPIGSSVFLLVDRSRTEESAHALSRSIYDSLKKYADGKPERLRVEQRLISLERHVWGEFPDGYIPIVLPVMEWTVGHVFYRSDAFGKERVWIKEPALLSIKPQESWEAAYKRRLDKEPTRGVLCFRTE